MNLVRQVFAYCLLLPLFASLFPQIGYALKFEVSHTGPSVIYVGADVHSEVCFDASAKLTDGYPVDLFPKITVNPPINGIKVEVKSKETGKNLGKLSKEEYRHTKVAEISICVDFEIIEIPPGTYDLKVEINTSEFLDQSYAMTIPIKVGTTKHLAMKASPREITIKQGGQGKFNALITPTMPPNYIFGPKEEFICLNYSAAHWSLKNSGRGFPISHDDIYKFFKIKTKHYGPDEGAHPNPNLRCDRVTPDNWDGKPVTAEIEVLASPATPPGQYKLQAIARLMTIEKKWWGVDIDHWAVNRRARDILIINVIEDPKYSHLKDPPDFKIYPFPASHIIKQGEWKSSQILGDLFGAADRKRVFIKIKHVGTNGPSNRIDIKLNRRNGLNFIGGNLTIPSKDKPPQLVVTTYPDTPPGLYKIILSGTTKGHANVRAGKKVKYTAVWVKVIEETISTSDVDDSLEGEEIETPETAITTPTPKKVTKKPLPKKEKDSDSGTLKETIELGVGVGKVIHKLEKDKHHDKSHHHPRKGHHSKGDVGKVLDGVGAVKGLLELGEDLEEAEKPKKKSRKAKKKSKTKKHIQKHKRKTKKKPVKTIKTIKKVIDLF